MRGLLEILLRRKTVLIVFLVLKCLTATVNGLTLDSGEAWGLGILAVATYAVIAWFANQGRLVSIWAISIIMLFEGSGLLLFCLHTFSSAPLLTLVGLVVTGYLFLGALIVFSSRHNQG